MLSLENFRYIRIKAQILLIVILFPLAYGQETRKSVIYTNFEGQQPNNKINVQMGRDAEIGLTGQEFTIVIKNLTTHKIKVYGNYFASLVCGNTKYGNIEIGLEPGESKGGGAYLFDIYGLTQTVQPEECTSVNKTRIKDLGFQITSVTDVTDWEKEIAAQPPNNKSSNSSVSNHNNGSKGNNNSAYRSSISSSTSGNHYNQTQSIVNDLDRKLQNNQIVYNAVTDGLQQLGGLIQQQQESKAAERKAAARQRQEEEEGRRQQRDLEAQQELVRIAAMEENNRRAEASAKIERERQLEIDKQALGNVARDINPSTFSGNIKQVYYIVYERNYSNNMVNIKTYALNMYSDGTWMLSADLQNKINYKYYFGNKGVNFLFGAYANKQTVMELIIRIKTSFPDAKIDKNFLLLNGDPNLQAGSDKDFWNN